MVQKGAALVERAKHFSVQFEGNSKFLIDVGGKFEANRSNFPE